MATEKFPMDAANLWTALWLEKFWTGDAGQYFEWERKYSILNHDTNRSNG